MELRICHLYPDLLNLYGDRGNITTLVRRAQWRGIDVRVVEARLGDPIDPRENDLFFIGGGEDRQQRLAAPDLRQVKGAALREAAASDAAVLAVCGGYQLLGHYYRPADGPDLEGLGLLNLHTVHPGPGARRLIGNIVINEATSGTRLVGFENHGGRTHLGSQARPLGTVVVGFGNNGEDRTEGAVWRSVYGTYLHGPLLPKNPWLADLLIGVALRRRYGEMTLHPLPDAEEHRAAEAAATRARAGGPQAATSRRPGSRL
ncbi:MAG: glutamine amidotransferase [Armatimonadetes bacterium]|nr:glutamine amidotransferase [Armatimonadota bacterium]